MALLVFRALARVLEKTKCAICAVAIEIQFFLCGGEKIKTQKGRQ